MNNGTDYAVVFDQDVTILPGTLPDSALQVDGEDVQTVFQGASNVATISCTSPFASGLPWALSGQPTWLSETVATPESGTTV